MSKKMLKATHNGKLSMGDLELPCFVLEDGTRVISGRGMTAAIGMKGRGQGVQRISAQPVLKRFMGNDLVVAIQNPLIFKSNVGGRETQGYEATVLMDLAEIILEARDAKALKTDTEKRYAIAADILVRSLAKVGIVSLVDEVTGYQEVRDRLALQKILEKYITDEWAKWTRTFPESFYKELFRLKGIPYPPSSGRKPSYVGHWTNDIIYSRLAPGVLTTLREKNPRNQLGNRPRKHHQYLTRDYGHPELKQHLHTVEALMRSSTSWDDFKRRLQRALPKKGDQIEIEEAQ